VFGAYFTFYLKAQRIYSKCPTRFDICVDVFTKCPTHLPQMPNAKIEETNAKIGKVNAKFTMRSERKRRTGAPEYPYSYHASLFVNYCFYSFGYENLLCIFAVRTYVFVIS
jgi:hypothetical protein